jgi:hypothetical protein
VLNPDRAASTKLAKSFAKNCILGWKRALLGNLFFGVFVAPLGCATAYGVRRFSPTIGEMWAESQ